MLSAKDAFKVGFLARCVENQMTPDQMLDRIKVASDLLDKRAGIIGGAIDKIYDVGKGLGEFALGTGLPLALAAPPIVGGVAGYGLARATDIDDRDVEEIKDREVLDEYKRQTDQLRRLRAVRDYQKAKQRTGRVFL